MRMGSGAPDGGPPGPGKKAGATAASTTWLGLGGKAGPGQVNLNLNQNTVVASVGQDQLTREREADGERRRSEHRGSFIGVELRALAQRDRELCLVGQAGEPDVPQHGRAPRSRPT